MAFETGTVSTASGLMVKLETFLTNAGWVTYDSPSLATFSGYKVLYSDGSLGTEDIYIGLGAGLKDRDNEPKRAAWQNQEYQSAPYDMLNVQPMQYWDAGTDTGTNLVDGRVGPLLWYLRNDTGSTEGTIFASYIHPLYPATDISTYWTDAHADIYRMYRYGGYDWTGWGRRIYGWRQDNDFAQIDFLNETLSVPTAITVEFKPIFAFNQDGDPVIYGIRQESAGTPTFVEVPVGENASHASYITRATPPAGQTTYNYASMVWDGRDYIYLTRGDSGSAFYRYTISTNTWDSMASNAATDTHNYLHNLMVYIPVESSIAQTNGWTSDKIIKKRGDTTSFYIYDVDGDSWGSLATAEDLNDYASICWDGDKYIWYSRGNNTTELNRYDIENDSWTNSVDGLPATSGQSSHFIVMKSYLSQLVVDTVGSTYWFFGDKNHCTVVLKDQNGQYYTSYFGIIDRYYSEQKAILSSPVSSGGDVVMTVSGQFDQWLDNKPLYIYDPSDGGAAEKIVPTDLDTGGGTITATLANDYGAGSKIGIDPQPTIMTANFWDAAFCVHSYQGQGSWQADNNPQGVNYMMKIMPAKKEWVNSAAVNAREQTQLWPVALLSFESEYQGNSQNFVDRMMRMKGAGNDPEVRGQLIGMYALPAGSAPLPESEDEILVGSDRYIVFKSHTMFDSETGENLYIVVGPKS